MIYNDPQIYFNNLVQIVIDYDGDTISLADSATIGFRGLEYGFGRDAVHETILVPQQTTLTVTNTFSFFWIGTCTSRWE